jgi:hypothetical protein
MAKLIRESISGFIPQGTVDAKRYPENAGAGRE